ncbi:MAG: hypothetical protein H6732_13305 [Alphaproteobacteria bacterium]|nr:hypothetical protein [Alphaproteobacteria bacterium]
MNVPKQITLRGPSAELVRRLRDAADLAGESMNSTILRLLEEAVGAEPRRLRLARYATWTEEEGVAFDASLRELRVADDPAWTS